VANAPLRVAECPNCNHQAVAHGPLDPGAEVHCTGGDGGCACPLDRAAVGVAIGIAAALVKFG
jgi:hypothetical protein